jgi:hypothetical protein
MIKSSAGIACTTFFGWREKSTHHHKSSNAKIVEYDSDLYQSIDVNHNIKTARSGMRKF